jgi:hypothetical protein
MKTNLLVTLVIALMPAALAQKWEFGGGAGGGFYTSRDVAAGALSGSAKVGNGVAASAWLANNNGEHWGGEIRYDFQKGDLQLTSSGGKASFAAQSNAIHYDFLLHSTGRSARVRPFVAFGAGVKMYRGTGTEVASQPLNQLALLTKTTDTQPLVSVGAGVKVNARRMGFRVEVHDFMTPFPDKVIAAADGSSIGGWVHDFVLNVGLSLLF